MEKKRRSGKERIGRKAEEGRDKKEGKQMGEKLQGLCAPLVHKCIVLWLMGAGISHT